MKKILKSRIFLVIITIILSVGTTVCGTILYQANQVSYTPSDANWNVTAVDEALNDLYSTMNTKFTNFKSIIAQAITDKGVATSATDSAETMAKNINNIVSSSGSETLYISISTTTNLGGVNSSYQHSASFTTTLDIKNSAGTVLMSKTITGATGGIRDIYSSSCSNSGDYNLISSSGSETLYISISTTTNLGGVNSSYQHSASFTTTLDIKSSAGTVNMSKTITGATGGIRDIYSSSCSNSEDYELTITTT